MKEKKWTKVVKRVSLRVGILVIGSSLTLFIAGMVRQKALSQRSAIPAKILARLAVPKSPQKEVARHFDSDIVAVDKNQSMRSGQESLDQKLGLRRMPTRDEILQEFAHYKGTRWLMAKTGLDLFKGVEPILSGISQQTAWDLAFGVGFQALRVGDLETARIYLRHALAVRSDPESHICMWLAWLENDPTVATLLLEEACTNDYIFGTTYYLERAMRLAAITGSDELHAYYIEAISQVASKRRSPSNKN